MKTTFFQQSDSILRKTTAVLIVIAFISNTILSVYAQSALNLPTPGAMITPSVAFSPAIIIGMTIHPENPLQLDFIVDTGDDHLQEEALKKESNKLINYFMATLTVPENEMWVNLSPYEKNRIIANGLGNTEMGRDMLVQDYILKQLTASFLYPEEKIGQNFWQRVYSKAQEKFATTEIPTDLFNKVWIVPQDATVYVNGNNVFVTHSHLKVMLEQDYLALESNQGTTKHGLGNVTTDNIQTISGTFAQLIREFILPEIEKEVNEGKNFSNLRQIYNSMILAAWYKKQLKNSLLENIYLDKNKTNGIDLEDKDIKEKIYNQYLQAYKKGVYSYIKEDYDVKTQELIPRKYFSGGLQRAEKILEGQRPSAEWVRKQSGRKYFVVETNGDFLSKDHSMLGKSDIDLQVERVVKTLNTSESVWAVSQLVRGAKSKDLKISRLTLNALETAFGDNLSKIEALMIENQIWRAGSPKTWRPQTRIARLIEELLRPKYDQLASQEFKKLIESLGSNSDLEVAATLNDLLNTSKDEDGLRILGTPTGNKLLLQISNIFGTQTIDDLIMIVNGFLSRIKEDVKLINALRKKSQINLLDLRLSSLAKTSDWNSYARLLIEAVQLGILNRDEEQKRRLTLWHEQRKSFVGSLDSKLSSFVESSDWDNYAQTLVEAINSGVLTNVEYINFYLESSALLQRLQEKNYRAVEEAAKAKGISKIVLNERLVIYKRARELVVSHLNYFGKTVPDNARVLLSLNARNSPDLTDQERQELYKKARELVVSHLNYSGYTVPGNASVLLSLNAKNSPDLTDQERQKLYKKARELVVSHLNYSGYTVPGNASVLLSLNAKNSPDLTDQERQELYKKARELVLANLNYPGYTVPGNASVLLSLNAKNSPDLTDQERQKLYKKARELVLANLNYSSDTVPGSARLLLSPANLVIDLVEGSMMTWQELQEATTSFSTHNMDDDDIILGIPNELLFIGAVFYLSSDPTDLQGDGKQVYAGSETEIQDLHENDFSSSFDSDFAMMGNTDNPGGIDFNANNLNLKEQGQPTAIHFNLEKFRDIQPEEINGVLPIIINITPVTNFPFLLGFSQETKEEQLSHL
jgi:hypothetical protein